MASAQSLVEAYTTELRQLLPRGDAWGYAPGSTAEEMLRAWARELTRIDCRAQQLLAERIPQSAVEMLPEWEQTLGLPEPCEQPPGNVSTRQAAAHAKLSYTGGQSPQHFLLIAKLLGYEITIEEHEAFQVEESAVGDPVDGAGWEHAWTVHAPPETPRFFRAGDSGAGDALMDFGNDLLECVFRARKPAHTHVLFAYDDEPTGYLPWTESLPTSEEMYLSDPPFNTVIEV